MAEDAPDWDAVGFVHASKYRRAVLRELADRPQTPTQLADATGYVIAHCSRALIECRERGLVDLLVDEDRKKGRIYGITDDGRDAIERVAPEVSASG